MLQSHTDFSSLRLPWSELLRQSVQEVGAKVQTLTGLGLASMIMGLWLLTLISVLRMDVGRLPWLAWIPLILWQTFLQTGLFITAHDAMHGTVCPQQRWLNDGVGYLAAFAYSVLSYPQLREKHHAHHANPATAADPDFDERDPHHPLTWYWQFMCGYLKGWQGLITLAGINGFYNGCHLLLGIPILNLVIFWSLPILLSSIQLFYFGIYLPHRRLPEGYPDEHRARSSSLTGFWSFISCYHFGYHWEHHDNPGIPWYRLPSHQRRSLAGMIYPTDISC
ncbi:MAG: fatty acid desaturase [Cyanobacteriota bacterium]|nr:fatty acid desaturase [Cyanobacteriota bacterium]